ncbi:hypothetical protein IU459_24110 [Nocardia amamiensis]|uniref:DUF6879 domain-containing protein n=1 Tax=Nocardia amamiensis TaxID=404578 RepID=A0ABS0CVH0_9NOCA|nr:DUF6879 family protein [Nocardia amamiensis]MBF6300604.1 hypothetical protein [Nocardia amamiensis]
MELFEGARKSAFHLEVRDSYAEPEESEPLRRFLNGEREPLSGYDKSDWLDLIATLTGRGITMSRVRVVTVPHSDYQRWLLSVTGSSVEAGEDIRYVSRHLAGKIPPDDWWLFDGARVAFNLVDAAGKPAGAAVTTDPGIVANCMRMKERLWTLATPYAEYVATANVQW